MTARVLAAALIATLAVAGCRQATAYQPKETTFAQPAVSLDTAQEAIMRAGEVSDWQIIPIGQSHIVAKKNFKNKHFIEMDVYFDQISYRIEHKSSKNLNYDGKHAHPTYSRFVKELDEAIGYEYRQLSGG